MDARLTITIDLENAAFEGRRYIPETRRILDQIRRDIARGELGRTVFDVNGNAVGEWTCLPPRVAS